MQSQYSRYDLRKSLRISNIRKSKKNTMAKRKRTTGQTTVVSVRN